MMPALTRSPISDKRCSPVGRPSNPARNAPISGPPLLFVFLVCSGIGLVLAQTSEEPDRGQSIYRQHCMDCHGASGRGDGIKAPFLSPRPGNLISAATSAKTDKELLRTIAQGKSHTAMPAWQEVLSTEEQLAVLQYIRSLVRFTRPPAPLVGPP
ncbi:MAG: putative Cytochrome c [Nitrospira sp.]|nr:putative Cytochrome c [Nitrospira sp.]